MMHSCQRLYVYKKWGEYVRFDVTACSPTSASRHWATRTTQEPTDSSSVSMSGALRRALSG